MSGSRRIVRAALAATFLLAAGAAVWWNDQTDRHDAMREAVTSFEPPEDWVGWTQVGSEDRGPNPLCVDVRCPANVEIHVVAVPPADLTTGITEAIDAIDAINDAVAVERIGPCDAGSRCLFRAHGQGVELNIAVDKPFDQEHSLLGATPDGFVEIRVVVMAY